MTDYITKISVVFIIWAAFNAGDIINPPKTSEQVQEEAQDRRELYVRSHNSYSVGK